MTTSEKHTDEIISGWWIIPAAIVGAMIWAVLIWWLL